MSDRISGTYLQTIAVGAANALLPFSWRVGLWGNSVGFEGSLDTSDLTGSETYSGFIYASKKATLPGVVNGSWH